MKTLFFSLKYLIWAMIFDCGIALLLQFKPSSALAAFIGRRVEGIGERLARMQERLKTALADRENPPQSSGG